MTSKTVIILWLVAAVVSDEPKTGDQKAASPVSASSLSVPNQPCTTREGEAGECIPYYLCNANNTNGIIDIPGGVGDRECESLLEWCCSKSNQLDTVPQRKGCGWRNPLGIKQDQEGTTKFAEFPWMCAVLKAEPVNEKEPEGQKVKVYVGGGSLIHPSVVLTAAHVAAAPHTLVRAGEWDTQNNKEPLRHQDREVESVAVHEDYNKQTLFYDIALLFLSKPMDLAPNVALACLPPPRERLPPTTKCFATGWGKDKFGKEGRFQVLLKKVEVPVVEQATCQKQLRNTRLGQLFTLHTSFMCAGGELGKDVCTGDGGSPLSCPIEFEDGRYMQSGIVAWSIGCGQDGVPGVYVDVSNQRNWIDDKIAGKGYDPKTYTV